MIEKDFKAIIVNIKNDIRGTRYYIIENAKLLNFEEKLPLIQSEMAITNKMRQSTG